MFFGWFHLARRSLYVQCIQYKPSWKNTPPNTSLACWGMFPQCGLLIWLSKNGFPQNPENIHDFFGSLYSFFCSQSREGGEVPHGRHFTPSFLLAMESLPGSTLLPCVCWPWLSQANRKEGMKHYKEEPTQDQPGWQELIQPHAASGTAFSLQLSFNWVAKNHCFTRGWFL